jgi:hypothetical protein
VFWCVYRGGENDHLTLNYFIVAQGLHFSGHVDGAWQKFGFGKIDYSTTSALCYVAVKKTCFSAHLGATFVPKDNTISILQLLLYPT